MSASELGVKCRTHDSAHEVMSAEEWKEADADQQGGGEVEFEARNLQQDMRLVGGGVANQKFDHIHD